VQGELRLRAATPYVQAGQAQESIRWLLLRKKKQNSQQYELIETGD
jgi:hypothetical protein